MTAPICQVDRPRVLCFGRFYDEIPGGMQRHVEHLFAGLLDEVDYVHLVPSRDRTGAELTLHGFPVIRTPSINVDGSIALSPALITRARSLHRQYQFNIVHLHFPDPMSHLASLAVPWRIPRIISWHADIIRHKKLAFVYAPFQKRAVASASAIVVATPSHVTSSPVLSQLPPGHRPVVIPYGFDLEPFQRAHPSAASIAERFPGQRIFALGRHVYYKGFDVLIRAVRQLPAGVQVLIGGIGPLTEEWKALAQAVGVADRVHFIGFIDDVDLPAYYQACDIFCLPAVSQAEAFGIVQVEAMACGKPVVSTRLSNGVDFVNQHGVTGLTVTPGDVDALAQGLNTLLQDNKTRIELGQQAMQWALAEFSLGSVAERTLRLYREVLAQCRIRMSG